MMYVVHDAEKVNRLVTNIDLFDIGDAPGHAIDCFIGELFSQSATAGSEDRYQPPANSLVEHSRAFAILIQPPQQSIKILLPEFLEMLHG